MLLSPAEMAERLPRDAAARARARSPTGCTFDLTQELGYRYPDFSDGPDPADVQLRAICERAFDERYGSANGHKRRARERLDEELALIARLGLAGFFLLHWEVLELARECALEVRGPGSPRHVLPPGRGRGSSVGSIVCYLTGLSHVDPVEADLSLGRFLNDELVVGPRHRPRLPARHPREADRRRHRALRPRARCARRDASRPTAAAARSATSARRSACRSRELERLARVTDGWDATARRRGARRRSRATHSSAPRWHAFRELTREIAGLPRHISQHPGGMVISTRPLIDLVPVQPAAMAGRQICQWDKDSCADAGFLKIDLLGLGMLSAVEDAVDQIARLHGEPIDLSRIPLDDPAVYAEIQAADTVGVFQIESRAQMQSLLRTRPENLDDLTVQVALVRPGPIQGKAVHPYIDHRQRLREDPSFVPPVEHESLREPLARDARRRRLPGPGARRRDGGGRLQRGGGGGAAPRDEPQAQRGGDRGVPRRASSRAASATASTSRPRTRSTTSSSASPASASRSRTPRRSRCSPTSRRGCATTTRPSSSARS